MNRTINGLAGALLSLLALAAGCDRDTYVIVHAGDSGTSTTDVQVKQDGCVRSNKGVEICD